MISRDLYVHRRAASQMTLHRRLFDAAASGQIRRATHCEACGGIVGSCLEAMHAKLAAADGAAPRGRGDC